MVINDSDFIQKYSLKLNALNSTFPQMHARLDSHSIDFIIKSMQLININYAYFCAELIVSDITINYMILSFDTLKTQVVVLALALFCRSYGATTMAQKRCITDCCKKQKGA